MTEKNDDKKKPPVNVVGNAGAGLAEGLIEEGDPGDDAVMDSSRLRELAPDAYEILRCFYLPSDIPGVGGVASTLRINRGPLAEIDSFKLLTTMAAGIVQAGGEALVAQARQADPNCDPVEIVDTYMTKIISDVQDAFQQRGYCDFGPSRPGPAGRGVVN